MTTFSIRQYNSEDIPALKALWLEAFGDEPQLIDRFFELLPSMGTGFVAERFGEVAGAAYLLDASLHVPGAVPCHCGYIYAVAVNRKHRKCGIGGELTRHCVRSAWDTGAKLVAVLPAEASLYPWYENACGAKPAFFCKTETVEARDLKLDIREIEADEYGFKREDFISSGPFIRFSYSYLLFQQAICRCYGGGMYEYCGGIACGYIEDEALYIREIYGDSPEFIPALCAKLGVKRAVIRRASNDGEAFVAAYEAGLVPGGAVWGCALD